MGAKSCGERVQNGWVVVFVVKVEESKTLVPILRVKRDWDSRQPSFVNQWRSTGQTSVFVNSSTLQGTTS